MLPNVRRVDVSVFDLHTCLTPFTDPTRLRKEYVFLSVPEAYQGIYNQGTVLETPHHRVRPLRRELLHNHFWRRYGDAPADDAATAAWQRLLPFVGYPRGFDAKLDYPVKKLHSPVRAAVLLWPFGWSSTVRFQFTGDFGLDEIRELSQILRSRDPKAFRLGAGSANLGDLFRALSSTVKLDLFGDHPSDDRLVFSRHVLLTIPSFGDGSVAYWYGDEPVSQKVKRLADSERADLHSALLGTELSLSEMIDRQKKGGFLLVPFWAAGFAITYFNLGTLLYLGEAAAAKERNRRLERCLAANVRNCSLVTSALQGAIAASEAMPAPARPSVVALAENARQALRQLHHRYNNPFCRRLFRGQSGLAAVLRDGDGKAAAQ